MICNRAKSPRSHRAHAHTRSPLVPPDEGNVVLQTVKVTRQESVRRGLRMEALRQQKKLGQGAGKRKQTRKATQLRLPKVTQISGQPQRRRDLQLRRRITRLSAKRWKKRECLISLRIPCRRLLLFRRQLDRRRLMIQCELGTPQDRSARQMDDSRSKDLLACCIIKPFITHWYHLPHRRQAATVQKRESKSGGNRGNNACVEKREDEIITLGRYVRVRRVRVRSSWVNLLDLVLEFLFDLLPF
mgnify:CR=1 FL=1